MKMVNSDEVTDIRMMEGVKLLMMLHAIDVYEDMTADREVPVFVWLMYARDTSDNPRMLFKNHINMVGDNSGLEQVC
jgi:ubiquitin thioesterase otulin